MRSLVLLFLLVVAGCAGGRGSPLPVASDTARVKQNFDAAFEKLLHDHPPSADTARNKATDKHDLVWPKMKPP